MLGNFKYSNPTKLYFGDKSLEFLKEELVNYGDNILLVYGGKSIKSNGLYDEVVEILTAEKKNIFDLAGVMANPTLEKLYEGMAVAKENNIDLILAIGGGSVIDYAKALSYSTYADEDPWEKFFVRKEEPTNKIIPVGTILTMVGTASEMNGGSVITNTEKQLKVGAVFSEKVYPKFSILNPLITYTVPKYQMVSGIFDIMSHIMEQYISGFDDSTSDYIAEGLMKSLINSSRIAIVNPEDYEARSNIMWTSTWALNGLIGKGKPQDWMVHMIGQSIGGVTDATHGMTLAAVSLPYYRHILDAGLHKFKRLALNVWGVQDNGQSDKEIALSGLAAMQKWMEEIGVVLHSSELGVTEENIPQIVAGTFLLTNGYKKLTAEDVTNILKESLYFFNFYSTNH